MQIDHLGLISYLANPAYGNAGDLWRMFGNLNLIELCECDWELLRCGQ